MTKNENTPQPSKPVKTDSVTLTMHEGEDAELRAAEAMSGPFISNAFAFNKFTRGTVGDVSLDKLVIAMAASAERVKSGDMRDVEAILVSQATVLNGLFADLVRRSSVNLGSNYFEAGERYLKLAYKAQNQCRMALETLSTIKNPPVVYAKQANIAHGPQQVNNGHASATRASETRKSPNELLEARNEEPLDTGATGATGAGDSALEAVGMRDRSTKR
jgi:hypothetical protein